MVKKGREDMQRKPDITGGQMAASAGINTFFTVNCLIDFSMANFAVSQDQVAFLQQVRIVLQMRANCSCRCVQVQ